MGMMAQTVHVPAIARKDLPTKRPIGMVLNARDWFMLVMLRGMNGRVLQRHPAVRLIISSEHCECCSCLELGAVAPK